MTSLAAKLPFYEAHRSTAGLDISNVTRIAVMVVGSVLSVLSLVAVSRGVLGFAPSHPNVRSLAIMIHVTTVIPAIPLGAYLLLTPKGGKRHKQLGKLWLMMMLITASAAIFIKTGGSYSFIHIFIPMTFWASYKVITSARRGDMKTHKKEILSLYLGALTIPGIVAFALPGRLMNVLLFW
ncbi:MAG: DUF2306 domain-containing protein [Erythrobacter sp.]